MTLWDTLNAIARRWYIVLVGIACTAMSLYVVAEQNPVFYSRASAYFLAPASELYPNVLRTTSLDLVATAGVVAARINGTESMTKVASPEVTLIGRGILDGSSIALPDNGGQWSANYDVQALDIQVTAPTKEEVRARLQRIFERIEVELQMMQDEADVPEVDRITTVLNPTVPPIYAMSGERRRSQLMTVAVGGGLTLLAIGLVELRAARRRLRAPRTPRTSRPTANRPGG